jgi:hypothetical protein
MLPEETNVNLVAFRSVFKQTWREKVSLVFFCVWRLLIGCFLSCTSDKTAVQNERVNNTPNTPRIPANHSPRGRRSTSSSINVRKNHSDQNLADSTTLASGPPREVFLSPAPTAIHRIARGHSGRWFTPEIVSNTTPIPFSPLTDLSDYSCPRLLFSAVSWALSIPGFQTLSSHDQQILLEEALLELLVMTALQLRGSVSLESIHSQLKQYMSLTEHHKLDELMKFVSYLNPPLNQLELTSLKALLLFRPG